MTAVTYVLAQRNLASEGLDAPLTARLWITPVAVGLALAAAALLGLTVGTLLRRTTGAVAVVVTALLVLTTLTGLVPGTARTGAATAAPVQGLNRLETLPAPDADEQTLAASVRRWAAR